jgi:2-methylisocitrate lyase-like PEP mutase family enzyme
MSTPETGRHPRGTGGGGGSAGRSRASSLRELVSAEEVLVAPGAQDAVSALLVEEAGFDAFFLGDYNASAVLLGAPDYGLVTLDEMSGLVSRLTAVTTIPLIADAGCGFGNALNVTRAVQAYERAGAAGITLEDQVFPKRCGHMAGKQVIPLREMTVKIDAARSARVDPDLVLIARTDSIATGGVDEAIRRGRAFADAGADAFWADAVASLDDLARIVAEVPLPVQVAMIEGGRTPHVTSAELQEIGVAVELCGLSTLYAATGGIRAALRALRREGTTRPVLESMVVFDEFNEIMGLSRLQDLERRFAT